MKTTNIIKELVLVIFLIIISISLKAQCPASSPIIINSTPQYANCSTSSGVSLKIEAPTEVLTGDNISLTIQLPAVSSGCIKDVKIVSSSILDFVSAPSNFPFTMVNPHEFVNSAVITPQDGQIFTVIFQFPRGITCNGAIGDLTVKLTIDCGGVMQECQATVHVKARAANYWHVKTAFLSGNMLCGNSTWKIELCHNNPNGYGLGCYNLIGSITENPLVTLVSTTSGMSNINKDCTFDATLNWFAVLQNCPVPVGSNTIDNVANYLFNLGNGCETMQGTITATSPALVAPNASISFMKGAGANGNHFFQNCQGFYNISVYNNGNTPWTNLVIDDDFSNQAISVYNVGLGGWTANTTNYSGPVQFTRPGFVLDPGVTTWITIYYDITGAPGTVIQNTAYLQYQGGGGVYQGNNTLSCPGITCPTINTTIQNTSTSCSFTVENELSLPTLSKCVMPNPNLIPPPCYQVGDVIKFRIQVGNQGKAPLNNILSDVMDNTPIPAYLDQNLEIIQNSITTAYYEHQFYNNCGYISGTGIPFSTVPGASFSYNVSNLQSPTFNIQGLPGDCDYHYQNILVIEFDVLVLPQISGNKVNQALIANLNDVANYTVTKSGVLHIDKIADVQFIDNGGNFNYFLTVTNFGSENLKNIEVWDTLPSCVQRSGNLSVLKKVGGITSSVAFQTMSPDIHIKIPNNSIAPGDEYIIRIPVTKTSGSMCCNRLAYAKAEVENTAILTIIDAKSNIDEIACVQSNLCCDIEDVAINLFEDFTPLNRNRFRLHLASGPDPIQEISVSMIDYHVTYTNSLCQPENMGIFGNIFSTNVNVGGLNLTNNNSYSVSWLPGSPINLNHDIRLFITKPAIINLSCCDGKLFFCLKVRIKDINCDVCEKIVCGSVTLKDLMIANPEGEIVTPNFPFIMKQPNIKPQYYELNEKMKLEKELKNEVIIKEREDTGVEENSKLDLINDPKISPEKTLKKKK